MGIGIRAGACTPGGYHVKWGVDGAGVEGAPVPLAVGAARAHASAFLAALHVSGAAAWPELTPPL
jgi:hypothetical protein